MTEDRNHSVVEEMRRSFDASFAVEPSTDTQKREEFLLFRVQKHELAVRTIDLGGVLKTPRLTPLPDAKPSLLGLGSIRGALVAAYSIASFLDPSTPPKHGDWMFLSAQDRSVGLIFDALQGYRVLSSDHLLLDRNGSNDTSEIVVIDGHPRPLLNLPKLLGDIGREDIHAD